MFLQDFRQTLLLLVPEPTVRSAVPGVSPGRGLLISLSHACEQVHVRHVLSSARSDMENTTKVVVLKANYNVGVEVLSG